MTFRNIPEFGRKRIGCRILELGSCGTTFRMASFITVEGLMRSLVISESPVHAPQPRTGLFLAWGTAARNYCEIFSSGTPLVLGPKMPITAATIPMQPAMKTNTPGAPKCFKMAAMTKALNTVERREKE